MTAGSTVYRTISLILFCVKIAASSQECSSFCVCDTWYGLQRASCTSRHLYSIHTGAPNNIQALDLSDNVISFLNSYELTNADYRRLKYLNVSKNAISEIGLNAFDGLTDLAVLDLSRNRLYYILDEVFEGNQNLNILKLSGNNFNSHVPKLRSSSIMELSLDSCQISHLPPDTFKGLTHVRRLDLSNNLMIQMSHTVVQTLHFLKKISLEGNPWSCNRILQNLELYLKHKNVVFSRICSKEANVQKFEKMIILPNTKSKNYHRPAIRNSSTVETKTIIENNVSSTSINNQSICERAPNEPHSVHSIYLVLFVGFISGVACGLVISYIWLSRKFLCYRRYRHRDRLHDVSQRICLLNSYLHGRMDSDGSLIEPCPGTPPPPYREVILRPNLYGYPSVISNLNSDRTTC